MPYYQCRPRKTSGYNYDILATDLNRLVTKLDLRDAALVGFPIASGEVPVIWAPADPSW